MISKILYSIFWVSIVRSGCSFLPFTFADAFTVQRCPRPVFSSLKLWNDLPSGRILLGTISYQTRKIRVESSSVLNLQKPSNQETTSTSENENEPLAYGEMEEEPTGVKDTIRKVGKGVSKAAVYGFSYFMNIVGLYFTVGILLNIFGFAYEFSFKEGYKVDTIENKRIERQFERESRRYENERLEKLSQSTIAPQYTIASTANDLDS